MRVFYLTCAALVFCACSSLAAGDDLSPEAKKEFEKKIMSNEPSERAAAVSILKQADDEKAFKLLLKILERERDDTVLEAIFDVMKGFTDKKVIEAVGKVSRKCRIAEQRVGYVKALWEYDNEDSFKAVFKLMTDTAWQVRMTVAECLADTAKKKGFEKAKLVIDRVLKWVFKEPDGRTQNKYLATLYYLTGKDYGLDRDAWKKWWDHMRPLYGKPKKDEEGKTIDKDGDGKPDMTTELPKKKWREPVARDEGGSRPKFFGHELKNARVIFVIDRTGSMNEASSGGKTKLQVLKDELTKTISSFDKRYWFNMYFYSVGCFVWKPKLQKATDQIKTQAIQYIKNLAGAGMTDIGGALRKASQDPDADTIILLTDGKPTAGITDTEQLLKDVRSWNKFKKIKINTVGMAGCDPNFLQKLAQQNGGSFTNAP
jgi:uncharacterized protein YegL